MTNCQMTNDERNPNDETRKAQTTLGFWKLSLRLSFVIWHSAFVILLLCFLRSLSLAAQSSAPTDYSAVDGIFSAHCLDCHAANDPEGQFVLESFETLMKGGEIGPAIVPGKSADSLLVQMIEGRFEKEGKKKIMPPGKRAKLTAQEIATIKAWIDTGAHAPATPAAPKELVVPRVVPKAQPRNPVNALACAPDGKLIAVARYGEVELRSAADLSLVRKIPGHRGNVNALVFSSDGAHVFAAGGQPGLRGEVRQWTVAEGTPVRTLDGHKDAIYSAALSPDGKILATGSYDQKIKLWNLETGKEIKTLSGHNGCVYDLAFRADGKILASASADRTVKLWDVASGERRDTLSQSLKELYSVAFTPDGKRLLAGGADNRIRVWEISQNPTETTDPIVYSKFAHEGAILNLVFSADGKTLLSSADDRTIKLWDPAEMKERLLLEKQPDWAPALAFVADKTVIVGRLDGSLGAYDIATGKVVASVEAPATAHYKSSEKVKLANATQEPKGK
jgi:WD40 repeat protein